MSLTHPPEDSTGDASVSKLLVLCKKQITKNLPTKRRAAIHWCQLKLEIGDSEASRAFEDPSLSLRMT